MNLIIEPIRNEDLPEILAIEATSFSIPWTGEMFEKELARKDLSQILVARLTDVGNPPPVAGYICHWVVGEELHVNNLAVDRRWHRRGIGGALLQTALEEGRLRGARCAFLEVRASNVAAQTLYLRHGFESAGVRKSYSDRPPEDAVLMKRDRL
jgi:ribosomal-protein-alanine N-acetyltransferase